MFEQLHYTNICLSLTALLEWSRSGLHNIRSARSFLAACESFLSCRKCCKSL